MHNLTFILLSFFTHIYVSLTYTLTYTYTITAILSTGLFFLWLGNCIGKVMEELVDSWKYKKRLNAHIAQAVC